MFPQNRNVRIGGAVVFGLCIILGALYMRYRDVERQHGSISVVETSAPENSYLPDTNWEQVLQNRSRSVADIAGGEDIEIGDTLTDSFARTFFEDYVRNSSSGALNDSTQNLFLNTSLASLSDEATNEYYTRADISVGPATDVYLRAYGNAIAGIIRTHSTQTENEIVIFERALTSEDPEDLEPLKDFVELYDSVIAQTITVASPSSLVEQHLGLINSYLAVRNDIEGMLKALDDPLYAALRVGRYESDMESLYTVLSDIYAYLYGKGIRYTEDEPGSMFKMR